MLTVTGPVSLFEVMNNFLKQESSINISLQARSPCLRRSLTHLLSKEQVSSLETCYFQVEPETSKLFRIFESQNFAMLRSQIKQRVTQGEKHYLCNGKKKKDLSHLIYIWMSIPSKPDTLFTVLPSMRYFI